MLNKKVVAGSLSLALLAAPSLFGLEVASAAAYTKAKAKKSSPSFTISGAVNAAVRHTDGGYGAEKQITTATKRAYGDKVSNSNTLVGQSYNDWEHSYLQATAHASSGQFRLTGVLRLASRTNGFEAYTQDNEFVKSSFNLLQTTANGQDDDVYTRAADIRLSHATFGEVRIGKASTATGNSTKANFSQTGYLRGDVLDSYNVRIGANKNNPVKTTQSDWETVGSEFGLYGLNYSQNRIQYNAPELVKGLSLSYEYVSQSDHNGAGAFAGALPSTNAPQHDSSGIAASYKTSMSGVDFEGRVGYTSRAIEPAYRQASLNNGAAADPSTFHLRGTGASAAVKYMGFDASYAYAKLDPKNFLNQTGATATLDNFADTTAQTNTFGVKPAQMHAYELGYSMDLPEIGPIHFNGEMAESKNMRNDG